MLACTVQATLQAKLHFSIIYGPIDIGLSSARLG